jgi:quinol-cytochrome oxidoreductase complex cytochrome b subunit
MRKSFWQHLFPAEVTVQRLRFRSTFGLGLLNIALVLMLGLTGAVLMLYYVPTPALAYASVTDIDQIVPYGRLLRSIHWWSAHALVASTLLHLARVWLSAGYRGRARNWVYGVALGCAVLALSLTGYLLVWDQRGYWAVRIVTEILALFPLLGSALSHAIAGGPEVGPVTLARFYAWHVFWLPALGTVLVALHLFRVRVDSAKRHTGHPEEVVPSRPHLTYRFGVVVLVTIAALVMVSLRWPGGLGPPADIARPDNPSKAPWFFLALQEAVAYSALWGACIGPALALVAVVAIPWLDPPLSHHRRRLLSVGLGVMLAVLWLGLTVLGLLRGADWLLPWTLGAGS